MPIRRMRGKRLKTNPIRAISIRRLKIVFAFLCLAIGTLGCRMIWLQVLKSAELEATARARQIHRVKPLGTRRSIVDRNGRLIALDEERFRLWAHPRHFNFPGDKSDFIRDPLDVARKISNPLSIPTSMLLSSLGDRPSGVKLAEGLDKEVASSIRSLGISGLDLEPYLQRVYPQGPLFANVVGFLNQDRQPQAGLEQSLNESLMRKERTHFLRLGADGTPLPDEILSGDFSPKERSVQLTLDARLQELAVSALEEQLKLWDAEKAAAIVMDVNNGEILALASIPTYDPNNYWEYSPALFREWSVQDLFEPGSTFKPINLAIALEEGVIDPDGTVIDTGKTKVGGWPIYNHDNKANGEINFAEVLQLSSNVGMVNTMTKLDPSIYWDWLYRLGVQSRPQTDLPGAVSGHLKRKEQFISKPIESAVASYGQGFSLTPLKLTQLHALIANGGYLVTPHITRINNDFQKLPFPASKTRLPVMSSEVTKTIRSWMESVVDSGSGFGVRTDGYRIGGKTGTAEKVVNGKYQSGVKICSFVASLPIDKPRFVVLVVVDEPKGENAYGSTVAVPIAKKIIDGLLVLEKIPPSSNRTDFASTRS